MEKKEDGGRAKGEWGATPKRDVCVSGFSIRRIEAKFNRLYVSVISLQIDKIVRYVSLRAAHEFIIGDQPLFIIV